MSPLITRIGTLRRIRVTTELVWIWLYLAGVWGFVSSLLFLWQSILAQQFCFFFFFCRIPLPHIHSNKLTLPSSLTHLSGMPKCRLTHVTFSLKIYIESVIVSHADKPGITVIFFLFSVCHLTPTELHPSFWSILCSEKRKDNQSGYFWIFKQSLLRPDKRSEMEFIEYSLCTTSGA